MTRTSKQGKLRRISHRRPTPSGPKTGPKKDQLPLGYRAHENATSVEFTPKRFIPKIF